MNFVFIVYVCSPAEHTKNSVFKEKRSKINIYLARKNAHIYFYVGRWKIFNCTWIIRVVVYTRALPKQRIVVVVRLYSIVVCSVQICILLRIKLMLLMVCFSRFVLLWSVHMRARFALSVYFVVNPSMNASIFLYLRYVGAANVEEL